MAPAVTSDVAGEMARMMARVDPAHTMRMVRSTMTLLMFLPIMGIWRTLPRV